MKDGQEHDRGEQYVADASEESEKSNPYLRRNRRKNKPDKQPKTPAGTAGKTETFGSRHVKLITFLVCLGIFLAVFGPFSVFRIVRAVEESKQNAADAGKKTMTMQTVRGLSLQGNDVTWKLLDDFAYENRSTKKFHLRVYTLEDGYEVWAGGEPDSKKPSYLYLVDGENGNRLEIRNGDIDAFLSGAITGDKTEKKTEKRTEQMTEENGGTNE